MVSGRAKLANQAARFLEPGEQLQAVFRAQSHFGFWEALRARWPLWHLVAITDRAVLVLDLSPWALRPTRLRLRDSRYVYFGCSRRFVLGDHFFWVTNDFDDEIAAADAALVGMLGSSSQFVEEVRLVGHVQETTTPPSGH